MPDRGQKYTDRQIRVALELFAYGQSSGRIFKATGIRPSYLCKLVYGSGTAHRYDVVRPAVLVLCLRRVEKQLSDRLDKVRARIASYGKHRMGGSSEGMR